VANRWPRVWSVLDPGVTKYTFGRVYSNTRVLCAMCTVIHVADSVTRVVLIHVADSLPCVGMYTSRARASSGCPTSARLEFSLARARLELVTGIEYWAWLGSPSVNSCPSSS